MASKKSIDVTAQLPEAQARKLVSSILPEGAVTFTKHARDEMAKDDMVETDVINVLRNGTLTEAGELVVESWRYRLHTERFGVVVAFRSTSELVVVTAWRKKARGK